MTRFQDIPRKAARHPRASVAGSVRYDQSARPLSRAGESPRIHALQHPDPRHTDYVNAETAEEAEKYLNREPYSKMTEKHKPEVREVGP